MSRVKIRFPDRPPLGTYIIPLRIGDINYGGHMGNDALLSVLHESRVQLLKANNYTEMDAGGNSLIMADVMIAYKSEAFYGEALSVHIYADAVSTFSFDLYHRVEALVAGKPDRLVAEAKTGIVTFDYTSRKVVPLTEALKNFLQAFGN